MCLVTFNRSLPSGVRSNRTICLFFFCLIFTIGLCFHSISSKLHIKATAANTFSFDLIHFSWRCPSLVDHIVVQLRLFKWNLCLCRLGISLYYFLIWHANRCPSPTPNTQWTQLSRFFLFTASFSSTPAHYAVLYCTPPMVVGFQAMAITKNFKIRSRSLAQKFCVRWKTLHNPDVDTHTYRHSAKENHGTSDEERNR